MSQLSLLADLRGRSTGDSPEFWTPEKFLGPLRTAVGGFDFDPAAAPVNTALATRCCVGQRGENGLLVPWTADGTVGGPPGRVWLNPPYRKPGKKEIAAGRFRDGTPLVRGAAFGDQAEFAQKTAWEVEAGHIAIVVMLLQLPVLGTRYAIEYLRRLSEIASVGIIEGRVKFVNGGGGGGTFPSVLVAVGEPELCRRVRLATRTTDWPSRHSVWWLRGIDD